MTPRVDLSKLQKTKDDLGEIWGWPRGFFFSGRGTSWPETDLTRQDEFCDSVICPHHMHPLGSIFWGCRAPLPCTRVWFKQGWEGEEGEGDKDINCSSAEIWCLIATWITKNKEKLCGLEGVGKGKEKLTDFIWLEADIQDSLPFTAKKSMKRCGFQQKNMEVGEW